MSAPAGRRTRRARLGRGLLVAVAAGALGAGTLPATAAPVSAAAACRGTSGVSVIVDYYGYGGRPIDTRCAPGDPATGLAALSGAGLPYTFVPNQPGLVCTIDGVPDPCNNAAGPYWSYWHLRANGTWEYSNRGAGSYNPAPGATEGWAWGNGKKPRKPKPPRPGSEAVAFLGAGGSGPQTGRRRAR